MSKEAVYLDYAAATPLGSEVLIAMQPYLSSQFYNPSALYSSARTVRHAIEDARASVARNIGARSGEIVFTAGGTESDNLAVEGIMQQYPNANLLISAVEHEAVRMPAQRHNCREILVTPKGEVNLESLRSLIDDNTVLISCMLANNEVGTLQPIREIVAVVAGIRRQRQEAGNKLPLYVHTDACQASSHLDINVARSGVDMMTLNGGKIYGPKQSGILYVRAGIQLSPLIRGGGQEKSLRSGTENVAGIIGFAAALSVARRKAVSEKKRLETLRDWFVSQLQSRMPEVIIHGHERKHLPHIVFFAIPAVDNERLMMMLDEKGFMVATGSACSGAKQEASVTLAAMGVSESMARSTLRLSFGRETTKAQLEELLDCMPGLVVDIKQLF